MGDGNPSEERGLVFTNQKAGKDIPEPFGFRLVE